MRAFEELQPESSIGRGLSVPATRWHPPRGTLPPRWWVIVSVGLSVFVAAALAKTYIVALGPDVELALAVSRPAWREALSRVVPWFIWLPLSALVLRFGAALSHQVDRIPLLVVVHAIASVCFAVMHAVATVAVNIQLLDPGSTSDQFIARVFSRLGILDWEVLMYWAVLAAGYAYQFALRSRERELRAAQLLAQLNAERLNTLLLQLNPHFLFNALNAISGLVRNGERDIAVTTIARLGGLLHATLGKDLGHEISLAREVNLLQQYLDIEQVRFGERLSVRIDIPANVAGALVPTLVLQPLVENAIRHGFDHDRGEARVTVRASREGDALRLTVWNSTTAASNERSGRVGLGLSNTHERLTRLYGDAARLVADPVVRGGFGVLIELPFHVGSLTVPAT